MHGTGHFTKAPHCYHPPTPNAHFLHPQESMSVAIFIVVDASWHHTLDPQIYRIEDILAIKNTTLHMVTHNSSSKNGGLACMRIEK